MRTEQESDYQWPAPTADSIRAQLAAEREQRQAERLAELLRRAS